ncbi:MAG: glycosyltransferase [candidate division NC10 bacterium]|nr:glycosyltransferase [candidate division NC10 bacterium]
MTVTVIVPVFNARRTVDGCLQALGRLTPPADQVILVDNGSTDGSYERLAAFANGRPGVMLLREARRGPAPARNAGIRAAAGEILAFLDSDCVAEPGWLGALLPAFEDPTIGAAAGRLGWTPPETLAELFSSLFTLQSPGAGARYARWTPGGGGFPTANLAVRRRLAEELGGFAENTIAGEDHDLCARIYAAGYTLQYLPEAVVQHHHRVTFRAMLRQGFVFGQGHPFLIRRHLGRGLWLDLPGRSVAWESCPLRGWVDLASADKKFLGLLVAGWLAPPALLLVAAYAGYLCWDITRRLRQRGITRSPWMVPALAGCLLAKSAAMTAGRWWGSVTYGALCF